MKASEYGAKPPVSVGAWSFNRPDAELWNGEHFQTKEEAIAAGRAHFGPGVAFDVGRFEEADVDAPDADDVIDRMVCRMHDEVPSDIADEFLGVVSQSECNGLTDALRNVVAAWLSGTGNWPDFCKVADIERIEPEGA